MKRLALAAAGLVALSGCAFDVTSIPLPGGPDLGDDPYSVQIVFNNVLDLVPQSVVKVNDVSIGRVDKIQLDGWNAKVTVKLNRDAKLPDNAVATISQTSLLGEKFVAIAAPAQGATGQLSGGDVIPITATTRDTEIEEVLSALSLLLNGGGIEQISTITRELNAAMEGRESTIKAVLNKVDVFVGTLDRQKGTITSAIDSIDRLMVKLEAEKRTIVDTLDKTGPAITMLNRNRADLTKMLVGLGKLSDVTADVVVRSKKDLLTNLKNLQPILKNLNKTGDALPTVLGGLLTFPFPDAFNNTVKGDFANMNMTVSLNYEEIMHNLLAGTDFEKDPKKRALITKALKGQGAKLWDLLKPPGISLPQAPPGVLGDGEDSGSGSSVLPTIGAADPALTDLLSGGIS
jgi:phospholipid/cholesterol/gamma-HCH transport system substrate-binding protein